MLAANVKRVFLNGTKKPIFPRNRGLKWYQITTFVVKTRIVKKAKKIFATRERDKAQHLVIITSEISEKTTFSVGHIT
jgi:hypothetical protein